MRCSLKASACLEPSTTSSNLVEAVSSRLLAGWLRVARVGGCDANVFFRPVANFRRMPAIDPTSPLCGNIGVNTERPLIWTE